MSSKTLLLFTIIASLFLPFYFYKNIINNYLLGELSYQQAVKSKYAQCSIVNDKVNAKSDYFLRGRNALTISHANASNSTTTYSLITNQGYYQWNDKSSTGIYIKFDKNLKKPPIPDEIINSTYQTLINDGNQITCRRAIIPSKYFQVPKNINFNEYFQ